MPILTQSRATLLSAAAAAWTSGAAIPGLIPDNPYTHSITAACMIVSVFLVNMGFNRTQQGNPIPPAVMSGVDRQAAITKAGDAVVEAAAKKVVEETKP